MAGTSVIYYKLKNSIQQNSVTFDGSVIQIGDVKRLVAEKQGLGAEGAPEITLFDTNTGEEYCDDSKVIPRNTLVEVKRTPAAKFAPLKAGGSGPEIGVREDAQGVHDVAVEGESGLGEEESIALQNLLQGTASTWQKEVRQGALRGRGRGRGRGSVPMEYRCPRCEAYGQHWLQDCPTHGDPSYDRKRVRPPVGIPMTRLARSSEGGLVLPDGKTGTLVANEDAFAREILGLGAIQEERPKQEFLAIENGKNSASNAADVTKITAEPEEKPKQQGFAFGGLPLSLSSLGPSPQFAAPQLAGMDIKLNFSMQEDKESNKEDFFESIMLKSALMPRGPRAFLEKAYQRDKPLSKDEYEREQVYYREKYGLDERRRHRSSSPRRRERDGRRMRSRSRSRHRRSPRDRSRERAKDSRAKKMDLRRQDRDKIRYRDRASDRSRRDRDGRRAGNEGQSEDKGGVEEQKAGSTAKQEIKISPRASVDADTATPEEPKSESSKPVRMGHDAEPEIDYGESEDEIPMDQTKQVQNRTSLPEKDHRRREDSRRDRTSRRRDEGHIRKERSRGERVRSRNSDFRTEKTHYGRKERK